MDRRYLDCGCCITSIGRTWCPSCLEDIHGKKDPVPPTKPPTKPPTNYEEIYQALEDSITVWMPDPCLASQAEAMKGLLSRLQACEAYDTDPEFPLLVDRLEGVHLEKGRRGP